MFILNQKNFQMPKENIMMLALIAYDFHQVSVDKFFILVKSQQK
jgi:hypothetical protein